MEGKDGRSGRIASEYATVGRRLSEQDTVEVCAVDSRWRRMNNPVLLMLISSSVFQRIWFDVSNDHYGGDSLSTNRSISHSAGNQISHIQIMHARNSETQDRVENSLPLRPRNVFDQTRYHIYPRSLQLTKPTLHPCSHMPFK